MKKLLYILITFHISLLTFNAPAQVSQEWAARYHFISEDVATDIALDNAGNVYVTGRSAASNGYEDYATIKYNSSGVQQWVQRYNGPGNNLDETVSIAVDNTGNVYVTGFSRSGPDAGYNDFATIKYNSVGVQQWVRRYDGGGSDVPCKVAIDGNGDILVGGWSTQPVTGPDFTVIKYDSNGNTLWVRTYDSGPPDNQYDYAGAMGVDLSGNVYLTGSVGGNIGPAPDWATVKWNSQGVFQWVQRYNGPGNGPDYPQDIAVSDSGNVYVTGYVWGNNNNDYATIKYNSSGVQQWVVIYNGGFHDKSQSITVDDPGNVYVTGWSDGANVDYFTIKYSPNGVQQWVTRFNGPVNSDDFPRCIKLDTIGNVYVTGYATVATNNTDYCTIKYNNSGAQQWVMYYNGTGNSYDQAASLAIDRFGNVYVTGPSRGPGNNDYATIKYSQTTGIIQISNEIPNEYKLEQNFPNPFNPTTKIRFQTPLNPPEGGKQVVRLFVYDILGREVATLVNEELKPGIYEVEWDASNLSSGIYFYRLQTVEYNKTLKMILIK